VVYSTVYGQNIVLEPLSAQLVQEYLAMFSPTVRSFLHVTDLSCEKNYLYECMNQKSLFYCIFNKTDSKLIGALEIRAPGSRGQLYGWLHETYWGNGWYQEAVRLATQVYFRQTTHMYIIAHVDVANVRSYHALRKAGFAPYGFLQGPYGKQHQLLLRNEWIIN
jgi:RimJ/RimL family protein N-acetyltransferase